MSQDGNRMSDDYELMDSGDGKKYERFGNVSLVRPCSQAMWRQERPAEWARATATFDREDGNRWHGRGNLPKDWQIETAGIRFKLGGTASVQTEGQTEKAVGAGRAQR